MNNYTIWHLVGPFTWPLWPCAFAFVVLLRHRSVALARRSLALGLGLFILLAIMPADYFLLHPLETRFPQPDLRRRHIRHIVVLSGAERLGASTFSGRTELNMHGERVLEGAKLARQFPEARLWTVGGVRRPDSPLADVDWTARAWIDLGVSSGRITKVSGTRDTCGNATAIAREKPSGTILLVTSAFHMPRAVACFRAVGLDPIPYPVDYQTWPLGGPSDAFGPNLFDNIERTDLALHEWLGLIYYRVRGRIDTIWPGPSRS